MSVEHICERPAPTAGEPPHGRGDVHGLVLHVEDDPAHADLVAALLEEQPEADYTLHHCARLATAIELLDDRDDVACVLLDLNLPDANSSSTLEAVLRDRSTGPPVIVLTGGDQRVSAQQALRMGAEDYLPKQELSGFQLARAIAYAIERRRSRQERRERESFVRTVLDSLGAHTAVIDRAGTITDVNESWRRFAADNGGTHQACGVGVNYLTVCDASARRGVTGAAEAVDGIRAVLSGRAPRYEFDYECPSPRSQRWFTMEVDPLPGPRGGAVIFHVPITRLKQQAAALEHLALHDTLTGLPNRAYFADQLETALGTARRVGGDIAVLICDLDDFKVVNDSLGHQAGDEVLTEVARRLEGNTRAGDVVARLSGDEFVVLLRAASGTEMDAAARRLRDALTRPVALSLGEQVRLGASIGVARATEQADAASLLRDADAAMYRAKELGRRRIHWFDDQLRDEVIERLALQRDLLNGLEHGDLFCHYQPQMWLADGTLFGFESLVRWRHPSHGLLSPARFVPIIERIGEAGALFDHVLERTLAAAHQWQQRLGWRPAMSVNLSAQQLGDPSLLGSVERALERTGMPPSQLWLEVTETAVAEAASLKVFQQLHGLGVRLAIDDFGTGQSSMARLAGFEWDACKIDRSFVNALDTAPRTTSVIEAAIAMAHSLDMAVVAEGVETEAQLARLIELGCDVAQGYLLARPAPADTFFESTDGDGRWRGWTELGR